MMGAIKIGFAYGAVLPVVLVMFFSLIRFFIKLLERTVD